MFYERYPAAVLEHQIQVRPYNAEKTKNMRGLNPEGNWRNNHKYHTFNLLNLQTLTN